MEFLNLRNLVNIHSTKKIPHLLSYYLLTCRYKSQKIVAEMKKSFNWLVHGDKGVKFCSFLVLQTCLVKGKGGGSKNQENVLT